MEMLFTSTTLFVITNTPLFGIALSIFAYYAGYLVYQKTKFFLFSPFLVGFLIVLGVILLFDVPIDHFDQGGDIILMFIAPTTVCLALTMYVQLKVLKEYLLPILLGTFVGAAVSVLSSYWLGSLLNLDDQFLLSMLPKSSTLAIALEISAQNGGMIGVTIAAVMMTGLFGATFNPGIIKLLNMKDKVAVGIGMGTSAHGIGVGRANDLGEIQGAMAGLAMTLTGLFIVIIMLFF